MKIKSFMGRRLLLGLTIKQVAEMIGFEINVIKDIERHERAIQDLNYLYNELEQKEQDQDNEK